MTELLVRNIDTKTLDSLKNRAKRHHRSLQGEIKFILEEAANIPIIQETTCSSNILKRIIGGWQGEALTRPTQEAYDPRDDLA